MNNPSIARQCAFAFRRVAVAAVIALLATTVGAAAELATSAQYIVGFVRFVHWNDEAGIAAWSVCVAGPVPDSQFERYTRWKVRGKPFNVRRVGAQDRLDGCQVLDLTEADASTSAALLQQSRDRSVLSVGIGADFCAHGGLICLRPLGSRQKFDINLTSAKASGLQISARLLILGSDRAPTDVMP